MVERQTDIQYDTSPVIIGDIAEAVTANGVLTAQDKHDYYFNISGLRLLSIDVRAGDHIKAGDTIASADPGDLPYQIEVQKRMVRLAEIRLEQSGRSGKEAALLELEVERLKLDCLVDQLAATELVSIQDGVVLYTDTVKQGQSMDAFQVLATVALPHDLSVFAQSSGLRKVRTGMKAQMTAGDERFEGSVVSSPENFPAGADSRLNESIIVSSSELPEGVKMGDIVNLHIIVNESINALLIPKRALRVALGQKYVQVLENGIRREINIETGIETATQVEVLSGLTEGMQVILK